MMYHEIIVKTKLAFGKIVEDTCTDSHILLCDISDFNL